MTELASYVFYPSLRRGLVTELQNIASESLRGKINLKLISRAIPIGGSQPNVEDTIQMSVELYGPGDILGFDSRIVIRTEPKTNISDFESNYFPFIEFAEADFPWRFTAAKETGASDNIIPWITLIVLKAEDSNNGPREFLEGDANNNDQRPYIVVKEDALPDLNEAGRWAHVQLSGVLSGKNSSGQPISIEDELLIILKTEPERIVSRLLCARRLEDNMKYSAFVVPTFKLGRYAGLGVDPPSTDNALTLSWSNEDKTRIKPQKNESSETLQTYKIDLPYYYKFEFATGPKGDFEYLIRLLKARILTKIGTRDIYCGKAGYGLPSIRRLDPKDDDYFKPYIPQLAYLALEGALLSLDTKFTPWGYDQYYHRQFLFDLKTDFSDCLNKKIFSDSTGRDLKLEFNIKGYKLTEKAEIIKQDPNWLILDGLKVYEINPISDVLRVSDISIHMLFNLSKEFATCLNNRSFSDSAGNDLKDKFQNMGLSLTQNAKISIKGSNWLIEDGLNVYEIIPYSNILHDVYTITQDSNNLYFDSLCVYDVTFRSQLAKQLLNRQVTLEKSSENCILLDNFNEGLPDGIHQISVIALPTSVTITWTSDYCTESTLQCWKKNDTASHPNVIFDNSGNHHSKVLRNLEPGIEYQFQISSRNRENQPIYTQKYDFNTPSDIPIVVPPSYGRFIFRTPSLDSSANATRWIDTINLDPRHRTVGGFGGQVIRDQQEQLMASAWEQLGAIEEANELLRKAQMGREGSISCHNRIFGYDNHFNNVNGPGIEDRLRLMFPLFSRVLWETNPSKPDGKQTVYKKFAESQIPIAVFDPAFRRIQRARGPIRRRQNVDRKTKQDDIVIRYNKGDFNPVGDSPKPNGILDVCDISIRLMNSPIPPTKENKSPGIIPGSAIIQRPLQKNLNVTSVTVNRGPGLPTVVRDIPKINKVIQKVSIIKTPICPQYVTCSAITKCVQSQGNISKKDIWTEERSGSHITHADIKDTMCYVLNNWLNVPPDTPSSVKPIDLNRASKILREAANPEQTISERLSKRLNVKDTLNRKDDLDEYLLNLEFPQPMYEPLRNISQDLMAPGISTVPPNTIGLLKTNNRFVEAYMCALSDEFSKELLWRECPINRYNTYFRQFWDVSEQQPSQGEIKNNIEQNPENYYRDYGSSSPSDFLANEDLKQKALDKEIRKLLENLKDIEPIEKWGTKPLSKNTKSPVSNGDRLVLIIRGDLLKKYPNTVIYAVEAREKIKNGKSILMPGLLEYLDKNDNYITCLESNDDASSYQPPKYEIVPSDNDKKKVFEINDEVFPVFRGTLPPDITFFGFNFTVDEALGYGEKKGYYFVIEERVSESRFGMDLPSDIPPDPRLKTWDDLSWSDLPLKVGEYINALKPIKNNLPLSDPKDISIIQWGSSSAAIASITLQSPVRLAVHAKQMIPKVSS